MIQLVGDPIFCSPTATTLSANLLNRQFFPHMDNSLKCLTPKNRNYYVTQGARLA
uniref:Uncharacterized protein n=1 Tax=Arundo donax TaxID=35708 RepID=A0A0A8YYP8_ARUDO